MSLLTSCVPYHKLSKTEFNQASTFKKEKKEPVQVSDYIRSITIYHHFDTKAHFDTLWLSDEVRMAYADRYCQRRGRNRAETDAFLTRQLEENKHWITLYVLAEIRERTNETLSEKEPYWTLYLESAGQKVSPVLIKEIEFEPEYLHFFGQLVNPFKTQYLVRFPVHTIGEKSLIQSGKQLKLIFSSVYKTCSVTWDTGKKAALKSKKVVNEDFYWR
jgi:hypothetical protein